MGTVYPRPRHAARPARRDQVPAVAATRELTQRFILEARATAQLQPREHRHHLRGRRARGHAVHGARVPEGPDAARKLHRATAQQAAVARVVELDGAGRSRARVRARAGHRPPRPQARQHLRHRRRARSRCSTSASPRSLQGDEPADAAERGSAREPLPPDAELADRRDRHVDLTRHGAIVGTLRVHVARAVGHRRRRSITAPTSGRSAS